ncbi:MAG TPA: hybrid sensor histidine kinase/response regulator [Desulfobacteraceae bacterium]|nr:hybrid sensor histidine kinase/response regulator [Desulfobacteraceae bacterium]
MHDISSNGSHPSDPIIQGEPVSLKQMVEDVFFTPRVLVVDDEKRIRHACRRMLVSEGCEVKEASNGRDGLEMINASHYDIVLLDLMMPGISGMEVLSQIKAHHPDTVIIVITGYATLEHSIETMKKGAFDFLSKPFSPQELRVIITKALEFIRTLQDISTEKSRMRVMIDTLRDGVLTTDHQKRIALANPAFLRMIGVRQRKVIGQDIAKVIQEPVILSMIEEANNQPEGAHAELTEEITIPAGNDQDDIIIGIRCIPFRDRLNRNLGTVTMFHDITALKKHDQIKSDFVSMVAHEIKSPLNSILMQLKVVQDGLAGDLTDKQKEILERSSLKLTSLTELATELLDLSKIESGLINQDREALTPCELIREHVALYQDRAGEKNITLTARDGGDDITVMANRNNMEEVLSNLISNAIRYTPDQGCVDVWVEQDDDTVRLHVKDTGFGIPKENLDQIWDKFFRVKNEKTRFINGTGLGLAIVKRIVDAHHGEILVDSEVDKGTEFTVCLPKADYHI